MRMVRPVSFDKWKRPWSHSFGCWRLKTRREYAALLPQEIKQDHHHHNYYHPNLWSKFYSWCPRIVTTLLIVQQWFCYSSIYTYHWLKERWVFYVSWLLVPWIQHTVRCLERIPASISSLKAIRNQVSIQLTSCWEETRKVSGHLATKLCISRPRIYILIL